MLEKTNDFVEYRWSNSMGGNLWHEKISPTKLKETLVG